MTLCCEYINQSSDIKPMDIATLLISVVSLIVACYAIYVSRVSAENQIINSILTNLTQQTNSMENYINNILLANPVIVNGQVIMNANHWSFLLTPMVKSRELFEMYEKEYASELTPIQFKLILKTFYIQVPQLIKMRINLDSLVAEFSALPNSDSRTIMLNQLDASKQFLTLASK